MDDTPKRKRGRPSTFISAAPGSIKEMDYANNHPAQLLKLMSEGKLDCEIFSELGIKKDTFYRWRRENEEFMNAFELGLPRCEAWWVSRMRQCWLNGDEKGFKYCIAIMNNKFGWGKDENTKSLVQNTVNIQGNMNVIQQKSQEELIEMLTSDLQYLQSNNVLPKTLEMVPILHGPDEQDDS